MTKIKRDIMKNVILILLLILNFACSGRINENEVIEPQFIFGNYTTGRIALDAGASRGVGWADYDADGDPDLYVSNGVGQWNMLYRNNGDGTFKKITDNSTHPEANIISQGGNSQGVYWVDYDNDHDLDLYVVNRGDGGAFLYRREADSTFTVIKEHQLVNSEISASVACWADIEADGDLDVLIIGYGADNYLFKNIGDGQFEVVNNPMFQSVEGRGRTCACGDVNNDGLPEFYIGNARKPNQYFINLGDWKFKNVTEGHVVQDIGYSYGASFADYDADGDLDLFVANADKVANHLYDNDGVGNLTLSKDTVINSDLGYSKGHVWGDFNNDGYLDFFLVNGSYKPNMQNYLYLGKEKGHFTKDTSEEILKHADTSAGVAYSDFDRDGDLDVFVANWGGRDAINRFYENKTTDKNWLSIRLKGLQSNSFGIGTKVIVYSSEWEGKIRNQYRWMYPITGFASQNDYELHFGLGNTKRIDSVNVKWPSGINHTIKEVEVNQHILIDEMGQLFEIK